MSNPGKRCIVEGCHQPAEGVIVLDPGRVTYQPTPGVRLDDVRLPVCQPHGDQIAGGSAAWSIVQDLHRLDVLRLVRDR